MVIIESKLADPMLQTVLSSNELKWLNVFFFEGDYPLALQLGIANALCVIAIVLMRASKLDHTAADLGLSRLLSWLVIAANLFLILNKDHRFIEILT